MTHHIQFAGFRYPACFLAVLFSLLTLPALPVKLTPDATDVKDFCGSPNRRAAGKRSLNRRKEAFPCCSSRLATFPG